MSVFGAMRLSPSLPGARKYSGFDIAPFIEKLKWKKEFMQKEFPDEFGTDRWDIDVDLLFVEALDCPECHKSLKIMRATDCEDGGSVLLGIACFASRTGSGTVMHMDLPGI